MKVRLIENEFEKYFSKKNRRAKMHRFNPSRINTMSGT